MNRKVWFGLTLLALSYAQVLIPRRVFDQPGYVFFGYPWVPGNLLAFSATAFALGVIMVSEGICQRFGGVSLWRFVTGGPRRLPRVALAATACGLALELFGQWLSKLWFYPYWTTWFYLFALVPGFAFYWVCLVESYLAVKAVLDAGRKRQATPAKGDLPGPAARPRPPRVRGRRALGASGASGACGVAFLTAAACLFVRWYAQHDGYTFAVTKPVRSAPPLSYALLAFLGAWLAAEWLLRRRGRPSLAASIAKGYWVPPVAVLASATVLAYAWETQNSFHGYWSYPHFPGPQVPVLRVQASVLATWPLQYMVFLLGASVLVPGLARIFWQRPAHPADGGSPSP